MSSGVSSNQGDAFLYKLDGTNSFTANCATTSTLTSPWCTLSSSTGQPITSLTSGSYFGTSVALNNTYALIGADGVSSNRGDAFLYRLDGTNSFTTNCATTGTLTSPWCTLSSSTVHPITSVSYFGNSVALNNTYALIGAANATSLSQGNAYLYKLDGTNGFNADCATTGTLTSPWCTLSASTGQPITALAVFSRFGISVALNDTYALIGANRVSTFTALVRGNAYLYKLDGTNGFTANCATTGTLTSPWCTLSSSTGQPITALTTNSQFGTSVALNNTYALIGAYRVSLNRGNAYLFNLTTNAWTDLATTTGQPITALTSTNTQFGTSVALNDTYALIGASRVSLFTALVRGNAYLFNLNTNAWTDLATTTGQPITALALSSNFGGSVALNDTYALIGATGYDATPSDPSSNHGNAYLYKLDGTNSFDASCATTGTLTSPWCTLSSSTGQPITTLTSRSYFGTSVALNDTYALIGASGVSSRGDAYLYKLDGTNSFTASCATTAGTLASPWCTLSSSTGQPVTSSSFFGGSVALNDTYALIGATEYDATPDAPSSGHGNAYLYKLDGTNGFNADCTTTGTLTSPWCTLSSSIGQPTIASQSNFGTSVALNDTYALIGATGYDATPGGLGANHGNAYLYKLDGTNSFTANCATTGTLTSPWCTLSSSTGQLITALTSNSRFGISVALNDTYALIGASGVSFNRGNAYLFNLTTNAWTDLATTTGQPITGLERRKLPISIFSSLFGLSVALNDTHALIGARGVSLDRGEAYLVDLKVLLATTIFTTSQILTMLQGGDVSLVASKSITVSSAVTYSGDNTLTLTSGDGDNILIGASVDLSNSMSTITLNSAGDILLANNATITSSDVTLSASTGSIGTATSPFTIEHTSDDWTSSNLTLTSASGGSIYLRSPSAGLHTATISGLATGALSLEQTMGNITINSAPSFPTGASVVLRASDASMGNGSITISHFQSGMAVPSLVVAGSVSLMNAGGSIGTAASPITIERTAGVWTSSNLALTSASGGSIYLRSSSVGLHTATISGLATGTLSLEQTVGNFVIDSAPSFPTGASVVLRASDASMGNITVSHFPINVASLSIVAMSNITITNTTGSIGSDTSSISLSTLDTMSIITLMSAGSIGT